MNKDNMNTSDNIDDNMVADDTIVETSVDQEDTESTDSAPVEPVAEPETAEQQMQRERAEYLDGWQRCQADINNIQKRHDTERALFTTLGKESLMGEMIPVLDNFDAAFANREVWESVDANWRQGIEYIHGQFIQVLRDNGVEVFGAAGDTFDALLHEPVEAGESGETVSRVVQQGYKIGDRIIRAAKVVLE